MLKNKRILGRCLIAFVLLGSTATIFAQTGGAPRARPVPTPTPKPAGPVKTTQTGSGSPGSGNVTAKVPVLQGKVPIGRVLNARPPIPFQSFPMVDLKTNQPLAPNAMMSLPNGRQVLAGKYYETLNKTEQQLNSIGMTMRGKKDVLVEIMPTTPPSLFKNQLAQIKTIQPTATFKANQFAIKKRALEAESRGRAMYEKMRLDAINGKVKDKVDSVSHPKTEMAEASDFGGPPPSAALKAFASPAPQFSGPNSPDAIVLGDPDYASLNLSTRLTKNMSPLSAYFGVQGQLGLTLLSQPIDPAFVSAGFRAPLVGVQGYTFSIKAPYIPAIRTDKPTSQLSLKGEQVAPLNAEVRTTIVLGIIPVTFAAGLRGKAGIEYDVSFIATGSTVDNKPLDAEWFSKSNQKAVDGSSFAVGLGGHADVFVNATVYASAVAGGSIDLGLCTVGASLGAETDLVLLDGRMVFQVDALMEKPANAKAHGKLTYSGTYKLKQAMAGQLFIEAKLDFCIKSVTYRYYLLQNAGFPPETRILFQGEPDEDIN